MLYDSMVKKIDLNPFLDIPNQMYKWISDGFNIEGQRLNFELNWKEFEEKFLVWFGKVKYMKISYFGSGKIEKEFGSKKLISFKNFA